MYNRADQSSNLVLSYQDYGTSDEGVVDAVSILYKIIGVSIFFLLAVQLLFPSNRFLPIDRRTSSISCATLIYIAHKFLLKSESDLNILQAVDFDVLLLLTSIMIINHIVIHLRETKRCIKSVQSMIQRNPLKGFWTVSFLALIAAPLLTNDGVCLLFVAPILSAFDKIPSEAQHQKRDSKDIEKAHTALLKDEFNLHLQKSDAIYFLLALACSANIGSCLTYTGNPQNMIVASNSIDVLPPLKFLVYMLVPTIAAWLMTTWYLSYCWMCERRAQAVNYHSRGNMAMCACCPGLALVARFPEGTTPPSIADMSDNEEDDYQNARIANKGKGHCSVTSMQPMLSAIVCGSDVPLPSALGPLSPLPSKKQGQDKVNHFVPMEVELEGESTVQKFTKVVLSPLPYIVLILLALMVVMIFVDVMSISGLICVSAMVMVLTVVLGNHYKGSAVWQSELEEESSHSAAAAGDNDRDRDRDRDEEAEGSRPHVQVSLEERGKKLDQFFEEMFESIDYNLLFIFLGLFVVVANIESTGLPKKLWDSIAGEHAFQTSTSMVGIGIFVAVASQFLGNVAVCQLAKPRVEPLGDEDRKLAWALISFISTVAGNLTLTGSAANLIVAEKSARIDRNNTLDFWRHVRVCFVVCIISCVTGAGLIVLTHHIDVSMSSN